MKPRIVFFGNERLATGVSTSAPTLQALIGAGYHVVAVVANHEAARSRKTRELEIEAVARKHKIPILTPDRPSDIIDQLAKLSAAAAVLVAYGKIIPQEVIDIFPCGIVNIHPSLLPAYRGPIPIEQALLDNSRQTGVSIMKLTAAMDAGPVYAQKTVELTGRESKIELAEMLLQKGGELLIESLPQILDGSLQPKPQDNSLATYCQLISKTDGEIDWTKPADQLEREIRAFLHWPGSRTKLRDRDVTVTTAHSTAEIGKAGEIAESKKELKVYCGTGALIIDSLKPAGKGEMSGTAFLSGLR